MFSTANSCLLPVSKIFFYTLTTAKHSGTLALLLPMSLDWLIGPFLGSDRQVVAGYTGYTTSDCRQRTWSIPQPSAATAPHLRPFSTSYRFLLQFILFHLHHFIFRVCMCWVWSGRCMICWFFLYNVTARSGYSKPGRALKLELVRESTSAPDLRRANMFIDLLIYAPQPEQSTPHQV